MKTHWTLLVALLTGLCLTTALAQETADADLAAYLEWAQDIEAGFEQRQGSINLLNGEATLNVPEGFYYLDAADAETVLTELWGNPFGESLGMLFPANMQPSDLDSWGVVISYDADGYISDKDAGNINYDTLLKDMRQDTKESNAKRAELGYETVELLGWATTPRYDSSSKKLYWAKELAFEGADESTLNYYVRVLGRKGVLNLNAIAGMNQLATVEAGMGEVLNFAEFTAGNRYADYNPKTDKKASYGVAGLIAGGVVASKLGLFAKLGLIIAKGGKLLIVGVVALGGFLSRLFGGGRRVATEGQD